MPAQALGTLIRSAVMPKGSWWLHPRVSDARKLRKVPVHVLLMARVCTWGCKVQSGADLGQEVAAVP